MAEPPRLTPMFPRSAVAFALLLSTLVAMAPAGVATGEGDHDDPDATSPPVEIWDDGPRIVTGELRIENGTTLIIRGIDVTFDDATVRVERTGRLIVESTPEAGVRLHALSPQTWNATVNGTLEMRGLPGTPIRVERLGGFATRVAEATLWKGGIGVFEGELFMEHVEVRNFLSGIIASGSATPSRVEIRDTLISSHAGIGVVIARAEAVLERTTFERGAGLLVTQAPGTTFIRNATLSQGSGIVGETSDIVIDGLHGTDASRCVDFEGQNNLTVRNVTCLNFRTAGIVARAAKSASLRAGPRVDIENVELSSGAPEASGIIARLARTVRIADARIGPVAGDAIQAVQTVPVLDNVSFGGADRVSLRLLAPAKPFALEPPGTGTPGQMGWMTVWLPGVIKLVGPDGAPLAGARVEIYGEPTLPLFSLTTDATGMTRHSELEVSTIDATGEVVTTTYRMRVSDPVAKKYVLDGDYVPTLGPQTFEVRRDTRPTPTSGAVPLLAALCVVAFALGRHRAR